MATIKKAQTGDTINVKKYLEDSKNRVNKIVTPLRKAEVKKGINTYDDYLKSKVKEKPKAKDGKWIQKATASIKKRGTEGVCTGKKFGGPTCKPGSKRYNLAKVFKGMAKKKK